MKEFYKFKTLFILINLLFCFSLTGNNFKFFHLNTTNGLSQNTIYFIHQDKSGIFWFGTDGGLNKWNGYEVTQYLNNPADSNSIGQGRITSIFEDTDGSIWIGTSQGGVSKYNSTKNNFTNYTQFNSRNNNTQGNNIEQITKFSNYIVIGTIGNGLYFLNPKNNIFEPISLINEKNQSINHFITHQIETDKDSTMLVAHNNGLIEIPNQFININNPILTCSKLIENENILTIYSDSKDKYWIGTQDKGVFIINKNTKLIEKIDFGEKFNYPIIRAFSEDQNGNIWVGTGGNGLLIIDKNLKVINQYFSQLNNNYSLSSNIIYRLYSDQNKNMWVGTYNGGLNYINNFKQGFNHIRGYGKDHELKNNAILSICEIDEQTVLIGTDGGGIEIFNTQTGNFKPLTVFNQHTPEIKNIPVDIKRHNNKILIGTYLKGLYVYDLVTGELINYRAGNGKYDLPSDNIWSINASTDNKIWLGTLEQGVIRFDIKKQRFYSNESKEYRNQLSQQNVFSLLTDNNNNLWVATQNSGIHILNQETGEIIKHYSKDDDSKLPSNEIWKIIQDSKNRIWVGTHDGGLCVFDEKTETFETIDEQDGLPNNTVKSMVEDSNGDIWVGTNKGLAKVLTETKPYKIISYSREFGLQGNEFSSNAAIKHRNNYLFMGGNNGFNYFNIDSLPVNTKTGQTYITDLKTLYHYDVSGKTNSEFHKINAQTNSIVLNYQLSVISFEFALIDYNVPALNTYKYKLEGFDKNWIDAGTNRSVSYTNLDPGEYIFLVEGTNSLGVHCQQTASVKVIILPPFWKKNWFRVLISSLIVLLIFLSYKLRVKSYRLQEKKLKQKVELRTKELTELNSILADKNNEIQIQSEELRAKSEHLSNLNISLETSNKKIESQNNELEQHRNHLEKLVKKRTIELEKAKLRAEESEELKMAFLSNMSHEIRTPMNAIVGFSSLLSENDPTQDERKMYSNQININSQSLLLLIDDILDLSKIEANQLKITNQEFDFIELINQIANDWQLIHDENYPNVNFTFKNNIELKSLPLNTDPVRIKQVLNNLLDNAFKFTCAGEIEFKAQINNKGIVLSVRDSGIGIDKDEINVIFDRFRKSNDSDNLAYRGVGLGLTISKSLSQLLGGDLHVESVQNQGSTFYFELPIK